MQRTDSEPLALDGYVRVSRVGRRKGPRFVSPAIQRDHIKAFAASHGARMLEIFDEQNQSGARADRPVLESAIRRIEEGLSQGLVVSKSSRFSRSLLNGLLALERIRAAGGRFYPADEGLDLDTDAGRLVLHILMSIDEYELERLRAVWDEAHAKVIARGLFPGSVVPFGYRRTRSGRLRRDPATAPVVTEFFRRRASGQSIPGLCRWLEEEGIATALGNRGWRYATAYGMLRNPTYLGQTRWGAHARDDAHEPLTDPATWELAQRPRLRRDRGRHISLLMGLVRCAGCSMTMSPAPYRDNPHGLFQCRGHSASGHCPNPASITASWVEPFVEVAALELLRRRRRRPNAELVAAEQAADDAARALARYRDSDRILEALGEDAYILGLGARTARVREARLHTAAVRAKHSLHDLPAIAELERRWPTMDVIKRRNIVAAAIDCVFVAAGHARVGDRITVCPLGTAPARLPRAGDHNSRARPFTPGARALRAEALLWPQKRTERELRSFLRGRKDWPSRDEFAAAGQLRLQLQVALGQGEHWWAYRLGKRLVHGDAASAHWTEARVRATLGLYLADKPVWPTLDQFDADGMSALLAAMSMFGGAPRWRAEFPVPRTAP